jgi:hypothetical protein
MSFRVKISTTVDENEWNNSLSKNLSSMIYQTTKWQELYESVYGSKPIFIIVRNQKNEIVGQLSCLIHRKVFWQDANPLSKFLGNKFKLGTVLWWYHGPIIHDISNKTKILEIILNAVDEVVIKNKVMMIRGISSPLEQQEFDQNFTKFGYKIEPRLTFVIDLTQDIDKLYNSLKKDTRYYIRKSEKEDFEFGVATEKNVFDKFQELKHLSKKPHDKKVLKNNKFFYMHWKILRNSGFENLLVARKNSEIEGIILTLNFNGNLIQHALANSPKFDLVGTFLTWNTIKWAKQMNYLTFDFAGVDPEPKTAKEKGIYFYAEKFGGEKIHYSVYTKIIDQKKYYLSSGLKNPKKILNKIKS